MGELGSSSRICLWDHTPGTIHCRHRPSSSYVFFPFHLRLQLGLQGQIFCMFGVGTWCGRGLVDQGFPTVVLVLRHLVELLALWGDGAVDWQRWWDSVTRDGQVAGYGQTCRVGVSLGAHRWPRGYAHNIQTSPASSHPVTEVDKGWF